MAAFDLTARMYRDAFGLWQQRGAAEDVSTYRQADIVRQDAWIDYQIARLELLKHTERHHCEPAN